MHSAFNKWALMPWNPLAALTDDFQVIAMDQRNAGQSTAPISATDGWDTYTTDQLALMDHLGVDRFAVAGMCIGGPYITGLCMAAPERVAAAVILQPIGLDNNHQAFYDMFDGMAGRGCPRAPRGRRCSVRRVPFEHVRRRVHVQHDTGTSRCNRDTNHGADGQRRVPP